MDLPQRHREHGVRIRKEEINHRNLGIQNIFNPNFVLSVSLW
jgi:hypothetical protein